MNPQTTTFLVTILASLLTSSALWGGIQFWLTRRQRRAEQRKIDDETQRNSELDQIRRERAEDDRRALLAEAQATAQRTALESAEARYQDLKTDYTAARNTLSSIREATWTLISLFETILARMEHVTADETYSIVMTSQELLEAQQTVGAARRQLR